MAHTIKVSPEDLLQEANALYDEYVRLKSWSTMDGLRAGAATGLYGRLRRLSSEIDEYLRGLGNSQRVSFGAINAQSLVRNTMENITTEILGVKNFKVDQLRRFRKADMVSLPRVQVLNEFANEDVAAVAIEFSDGERQLEVAGLSKRDKRDEPNQSIGLALAYGRAFRSLGNLLIKEANEAVAAADKERRRGEATKARQRAEQRQKERERRKAEEHANFIQDSLTRLEQKDKEVKELASLVSDLQQRVWNYEDADAARRKRAAKKRVAARKANAAKRGTTKAKV